jgi:hypothetical protein
MGMVGGLGIRVTMIRFESGAAHAPSLK